MDDSSTAPDPNPEGLCWCGCGKPTTQWKWNDRHCGRVRGQHARYHRGHGIPHRGRPSKQTAYIVDPSTGCWLWQRPLSRSGYGEVWISGKKIPAHRFHYEAVNGEVPDGLQVDHLCRNRACVNPAHLEAVTCGENVRRGRATKLDQAKAEDIRQMLSAGLSFRIVGERFGVSSATISAIASGKRWSTHHITEEAS